MTMKTFLNEAARKYRKGPTPPCVWMPNLWPEGVRRNRFGHSKSILEYFYYHYCALYPSERLTVLVIYRIVTKKQLDRLFRSPTKRLITHGWKYNDNFSEHSFSELFIDHCQLASYVRTVQTHAACGQTRLWSSYVHKLNFNIWQSTHFIYTISYTRVFYGNNIFQSVSRV